VFRIEIHDDGGGLKVCSFDLLLVHHEHTQTWWAILPALHARLFRPTPRRAMLNNQRREQTSNFER
jgi:hypothetical protein